MLLLFLQTRASFYRRVCVCVCARARVHACVHARMCMCARVYSSLSNMYCFQQTLLKHKRIDNDESVMEEMLLILQDSLVRSPP